MFSQETENKIMSEFCKLKFKIDTTNLNQTRIIELKVTNYGKEKLKISETFSDMRIQPLNILKYDADTKKYIRITSTFADVDCTNCFGKFLTLKPNQSYVYKINIDKLYFFRKKINEKKTKYKFSIWFEPMDILKYSKKRRCYLETFESETINYTTK